MYERDEGMKSEPWRCFENLSSSERLSMSNWEIVVDGGGERKQYAEGV